MKKKKLFAVLALVAIASLAFAQYGPPPSYGRPPPPSRHGGGWMEPNTYLSINFAVPLQWQKISYDDYNIVYDSMDARTLSLGVGVDLTTFFTRRIGLHVSADLYFPQRMDATYYPGGYGYETDDLQDEWDSDWGISLFAGPSFALLRTPRILFAVAPGIHYYMLFAEEGRYSVFQYGFGIGANAEIMFNLTRSIFLRAAVDITYDFWGNEERNDSWFDEYNDIDRTISVTPQIGIGFRL